MAHISLRISDDDKKIMEAYANLNGISVSEALKQAFFEKLEDEHDLKLIAEYEKDTDKEFYSHSEVMKELGL